MRLSRPVRTRFRSGSAPSALNLAAQMSLAGSLCKRHAVRPSGFRRHSPPTACRQTVSGSLSLPSPGFFSPFPHGTGSLSVAREYLALEGGPPRFPQGFSCPVVLGCAGQRVERVFVYRALTVSGGWFHSLQLTPRLVTLRDQTRPASHNPARANPRGLGSSPFARRYSGNHGCFLFLEVLRCFSSLGSPREPMNSAHDPWALPHGGSPIRASAAHSLLAAPRGFSQLATPFLASWRQGIHRPPLVA